VEALGFSDSMIDLELPVKPSRQKKVRRKDL
jgi:hypothetical protein